MLSRRWYAVPAVLGGAVLAANPVIGSTAELVEPLEYGHLVVVAPLLVVLGLVGFYRTYADTYSTLGRVGTWLLGVGTLGFVPISTHRTVVSYTLPEGVALFAAGVVGAVLAEAGTVGIAVDAWRTGRPSKWLAVWLPLALPATAVINYVGATTLGLLSVVFNYHTGVFGLTWIAIGYYTAAGSTPVRDSPSETTSGEGF